MNQFDAEIEEAKEELARAHDWYDECIRAAAKATVEYRLALARVWPRVMTMSGLTADAKKDTAEALASGYEEDMKIAQGMEKSALEKVRSQREVLGTARSKLVSAREELSTLGRGMGAGA